MVINKKYSERHKKEMWGYDGRVNGKRKRDYRFDTKKQAEDAVASLRVKAVSQEYGLEKVKPTTVQQAVDEYKKRYSMKAQVKDLAYQQSVTAILNRIQEFVNLVGPDFLVRNITVNHLHKWALAQNVSPATLSTYAGRLTGVFQLAKSVFADLADWTIPKVSEFAPSPGKRRDRIITPQEASALVQALLTPRSQGESMSLARHQLRTNVARDGADAFRIALATGMRLNEILKLEMSSFLKSGQIAIRKTKNKEDRTIPLPASVARIIDERKKEGLVRNNQVFPLRFEKNHYVSLVEKTLVRVANRAGLNYGRKNEGFTIHDARATYITNLLRGNPSLGIPAISMGTVMKRSGHKSLSGFQHYVRMVEEEQETATQASESLVEHMMAGLLPQGIAVSPINKKTQKSPTRVNRVRAKSKEVAA